MVYFYPLEDHTLRLAKVLLYQSSTGEIMRHAVSSEHRDFFSKHRYIEFEELLTEEQAEELEKAIDQALGPSLLSTQEQFDKGFDLWRRVTAVKKWAFKQTLTEIAASLTQTHLFRIGFDQLLSSDGVTTPLSGSQPLSALCCAKPLAYGLLICLAAGTAPSDETLAPFPLKEGNGVFFSPEFSFPWEQLFHLKHFRWLLIGYAPKQAIYHLEKRDPHTHVWKQLGYVFGDSLNDTLHPVIFRD